MTVREVLKILHEDGWREVENRTKGSHIQLRHPTKPGKVTVPSHGRGHPERDAEQHHATGGFEIKPAAAI